MLDIFRDKKCHLQGFGERDEQWVHPDPVVDVDVGQRVSGHVVKERQVEEAALLPVHLGVGEDEMQDGHEQDVSAQEDEQRIVHPGSEGVGEEHENEEPAQDLEEDRQEED